MKHAVVLLLLALLAAPSSARPLPRIEVLVEPYGQVYPSLLAATLQVERIGPPDPRVHGHAGGLLGLRLYLPAGNWPLAVHLELPGRGVAGRFVGTLVGPGPHEVFPELVLTPASLSESPAAAVVEVTVDLAGAISRITRTVRLQPLAEAPYYVDSDPRGSAGDLDLNWIFAAYVDPRHPALAPVLARLPSARAGSADQRRALGLAVVAAVGDLPLRYTPLTPSTHADPRIRSQRVRFVDQTLATRIGNCVDLSVLLASLFERLGLSPRLLLVPGHMAVGFPADPERPLATMVWIETQALDRRADRTSEPRPYRAEALGRALWQRHRVALKNPADRDHQILVIDQARTIGILPLREIVETSLRNETRR